MIAIMSATLPGHLRCLGGSPRRFVPHQHLFHRHDPVEVMHLVEDGEVHLRRHQPDGAALVVQRACRDDVLAEASLFSTVYHCDAIAVVPTLTLAIAKPQLRSAMAHDPDLAEAWTAHLAHAVQRIRIAAEILALRTVAERLDAWLAFGDGRLPAKGDWKTLATELAVTPEALYRELARRRRAWPRGASRLQADS